ncbi:hypothetical protein INS49_000581 [Diaporthe citri]|uniref:uncharacterized protein n=1 Tax=Diaporthe citri TaxID=83186 RepID=UPI001C7EC0A3|nr:uncharacterized protein INS49_000581 [Diaporthe citri]KAG6366404.1 hypothetical protein INS49_000581 [Diaporthe citri]
MAQANPAQLEPAAAADPQTKQHSMWRRLFGQGNGAAGVSEKLAHDPAPTEQSEDEPRSGLIRRVSRKVVPGLPRTQTFKRQQDEVRNNLEPVEPTPVERRAVSVDRRLHASQSGSHPADPRTSAPDFIRTDERTFAVPAPSIPRSSVDEKMLDILGEISLDEGVREDDPPAHEAESINDTASMTTSQYDAMIHEELERIWILNLSMHFRDKSKREKFFVTYREKNVHWRRVTISLDYRNAPDNSLEMDLLYTKFQRDKSAKIYEAIRESLVDIQFYDTVTNLKLQTTDGRLHINALSRLSNSRNVIAFHGVIVDDYGEHVKGLLISYAEQGALIDVLFDHDHSLPWFRRERWARQIVEGLSEIHESGFVQGDFTLSNIVIDDEDNAKIIDINRRGCPVGWEPPEATPLIDSNQRISMYIGVKSDLYQLGMVLWALAEQEDEPEAHGRPLRLQEGLDVPEWGRSPPSPMPSNLGYGERRYNPPWSRPAESSPDRTRTPTESDVAPDEVVRAHAGQDVAPERKGDLQPPIPELVVGDDFLVPMQTHEAPLHNEKQEPLADIAEAVEPPTVRPPNADHLEKEAPLELENDNSRPRDTGKEAASKSMRNGVHDETNTHNTQKQNPLFERSGNTEPEAPGKVALVPGEAEVQTQKSTSQVMVPREAKGGERVDSAVEMTMPQPPQLAELGVRPAARHGSSASTGSANVPAEFLGIGSGHDASDAALTPVGSGDIDEDLGI